MDKCQRDLLRSVVVQCRTILRSPSRAWRDFGVDAKGYVEDESMLPHLDEDDLAARRVSWITSTTSKQRSGTCSGRREGR